MTCTLHVAWDERLTDYHFGPGHPLAPVRVELTMRLTYEFGLWNLPGVTVAAPVPATDTDLELVHDARYIAAVRSVSHWAEHPDARRGLPETRLRHARAFGLGTRDQPAFPGMHQASALVAGATLAAARAVWSGSARHGASIAGGMHHAMPARASGYGVYNDVAVAIAWLLGHGAERIAYVDIDAHHGDGVQAAFYADPRVLTISVHRGRRAADRPGHVNTRRMAGPRRAANRPDRARVYDRGSTRGVRAIRVRLRPRRSGRPGDHGYPQRCLPPHGLMQP
jgi:acetoin utilization protein AcuC